jgi:hypothetical protein
MVPHGAAMRNAGSPLVTEKKRMWPNGHAKGLVE